MRITLDQDAVQLQEKKRYYDKMCKRNELVINMSMAITNEVLVKAEEARANFTHLDDDNTELLRLFNVL